MALSANALAFDPALLPSPSTPSNASSTSDTFFAPSLAASALEAAVSAPSFVPVDEQVDLTGEGALADMGLEDDMHMMNMMGVGDASVMMGLEDVDLDMGLDMEADNALGFFPVQQVRESAFWSDAVSAVCVEAERGRLWTGTRSGRLVQWRAAEATVTQLTRTAAWRTHRHPAPDKRALAHARTRGDVPVRRHTMLSHYVLTCA